MGDEREEYDVKTFVVGGNLKKKNHLSCQQ
jgi:hypothetical protein